jgi:hypothetical protein
LWLRVVNRAEQPEHLVALIQRASPPRPTARFRARAWREFQRALDPLAAPRALPSIQAGRPIRPLPPAHA